jgi:hypothetical protein
MLDQLLVQRVRIVAAEPKGDALPSASVLFNSAIGVRTANETAPVSNTTAPVGLFAASFSPTTSL